MKTLKNYILIISFACSWHVHSTPGTIKQASVVFEKWLKVQRVYQDRPITDMCTLLDHGYAERFRSYYEENFALLKPLTDFLQQMTHQQVNDLGYQLQSTLPPAFSQTINDMYQNLEYNPQLFVDYLKNNMFSSPDVNKLEKMLSTDTTVNKHKALCHLLFKQDGAFEEDEFLVAFANRLLEYCFNNETFQNYQSLLNNYEHYPLVRFLHSALWSNLVGDASWAHWHKNSLDTLTHDAQAGKRIIYPAGGADLYMLLQNGVYDITIVDPLLPSQERYYAEGWDWLIRNQQANGGIGDQIEFCPPAQRLTLTRTSFTEGDAFNAKLSTGKTVTLKKSITVWTVTDGNKNNVLGTIIMDRRFTNQHDFVYKPNATIVMSYDELIYAVAPELLDGWGINPDLLEDQQNIVVKQLRKPMTKSMLKNMRIATALNFTNVKFINFASDPS